MNGGAIAYINVGKAFIDGNTQFIRNNAKKSGGAIYFECENNGLDYKKCSLKIQDTTFSKNYALQEGGAIKWNFYEPEIQDVVFDKNQAGQYGDDISSVSKSLVKLDQAPSEGQKKIN